VHDGQSQIHVVAQKWCKAVKTLEEREVSTGETGDFHKLINTVVEILQN